jgi:hypothetical protein
MQLSPKVRSVLTVIATILAVIAAVLPAVTGVPVVVGAVIAAVLTALAGFGIVPPQVGGVQVGVVDPSISRHVSAPQYIEPATGGLTYSKPHEGALPYEQPVVAADTPEARPVA